MSRVKQALPFILSFSLFCFASFKVVGSETKESNIRVLIDINDRLRSSAESGGVRSLAWTLNQLGEGGLRLAEWKDLVRRETGAETLVIKMAVSPREIRASNDLMKRMGVDFVTFQRGDLEIVGAAVSDDDAGEIADIAAVDFKGRISTGALSLASSILMGWYNISIAPAPEVSNAMVTIAMSSDTKKFLPYVAAGLVGFLFHIFQPKINDFWSKWLWRPNDFWSRFLTSDLLLPLLTLSVANFMADVPPSTVSYPGPFLLKAFVAALLSAASLNLLHSATLKSLRAGTIKPLIATKRIAIMSAYTAVGRSMYLNSFSGSFGLTMQLLTAGLVAIPVWLRTNLLDRWFDADTAALLSGKRVRSNACLSALSFIFRPKSE